MNWELFDKAFLTMDEAFKKLSDAMHERASEHPPKGTVTHTKIVTTFPDGRTEETESTTRTN